MALAQELVIFLCILAAAVSVTLGYAVYRLFAKAAFVDDTFIIPSDAQKAYMREVRDRNLIELIGHPGQQRSHPSSK